MNNLTPDINKTLEEVLSEELKKREDDSKGFNLFWLGIFVGLLLNLLATITDRLVHDTFPQYYFIYAALIIIFSYFVLLEVSGRIAFDLDYKWRMKKIIKNLKSKKL